ncbi:class I SAM-dependent methyltransferase [Oceanobacillus iheyensis]|uniref:class I SAM-dependent methyltransferase n=1 Tax=Oceanobacillus iheyensis TaxID=182710 RepID=UPI0036387C8D
MEQTNVELIFNWLDKTTENVQQAKNETFLDSLVLTLEMLFEKDVPENFDDIAKHKLNQLLSEIKVSDFQHEEIRKGISLAILKGMKGSTQQQHSMTPDTVSLIVSYLANKLLSSQKEVALFDPASGTGNLLTAVMNQLDKDVAAYAAEVDPTLIGLAVLNANLQEKEVEFFHQDSLRPFLMEPVDIVISDLPVGYYPDDISASDYELKSDEGHSYSHHLFIEQSLTYMKEGAYFVGVVPEFLFDSDQSDKLHAFLQKHAHIVGVIRLPESAFKSKQQAKSILILQKKGEATSDPKQPLLVQMPSFKNAHAMADILKKMDQWFASYPKGINSK